MGFRLVPKSVTLNDLERRNGRYCALISYRILQSCQAQNLVILGAYCVKVVDTAITMDHLRLLSSSKRLQRNRATPTV